MEAAVEFGIEADVVMHAQASFPVTMGIGRSLASKNLHDGA